MTHYICMGECGGDSKESGKCQAETCSRHGEDLVECNCEDWKHGAEMRTEMRRPRPSRK